MKYYKINKEKIYICKLRHMSALRHTTMYIDQIGKKKKNKN